MRNSMSVLLINIFLLLSCFSSGQYDTKKHIRRNAKAEHISYGDSGIYARGLYNDSSRFFIGNSDGSMYYLNMLSKKSQLLFKLPDFMEMRDIERSGPYLIGIQSGETGKMVRMDQSGGVRIIQHPEWKGLFIDAIDFLGSRGFMLGDPVDSLFSLFHSVDNGLTWERCESEIKAFKDEAAFAASGTNVQVLNDSTYVFVSGGMKSRFFKSTDRGKSWKIVELPYYPGLSTGPYSMCFATDSIGVLVGGDYKDADIRMNTCFYTNDGGESWLNADHAPRGYRSCVYYVNEVFYSCGTNGIDFSLNGGLDWIPFADGTYFSLASYDNKLVATTKHGTVVEFELIEEK